MLTRLSHSALDVFRQCPKKFWFAYVDRVKLPKRVYAHLQLGTIVHRQLAALYRQAQDGKVASKEDILVRYEHDWSQLDPVKLEVAAEHMAVDDYIESGRRMLSDYYDRFQPFDQGMLIMAEGDITFRLPRIDFSFIARIDRVLKRPDGVIEICDYKTGGQALPSAQDRSFRNQMGLYQLAVRDRYPQFEVIEVVQYALKYNDRVVHCFRSDELDELAEQFRGEAMEIASAHRLDDWPEKESGLCRYCDYFHLCPRKRHQLALEADGEDKPASVEEAVKLADKYLELSRIKKETDGELRALKEELVAAAKELGLSKFTGSEGHVTISIRPGEKLPTKTGDAAGFAELVHMVREKWKLQECLTLDSTILLKDFYRKGRLTDEQVAELEPHIIREDNARVTAKHESGDDDPADDAN